MKKMRYRLSPELGDGQHWTVVTTKGQLLELVGEWCDNCNGMGNRRMDVKTVYMSDEEVDALPDI